jgi:putative nucleotidyltransferase with HDIG domain
MNKPLDPMHANTVLPSQLCVGLYVHLDLKWSQHPFPFSSFKIKTADQIATIQSLGLERVRIAPEKSDCQPLAEPLGNAPTAPVSVPKTTPDLAPVLAAKASRLERLQDHRQRMQACEQQLLASAKVAQSVSKNLLARPEDVKRDVAKLVDSMADSMLMDADIAIHLMGDRVKGEVAYNHSLNVAVLAMILAREMKLPSATIRAIGQGAMFHDVGESDLPPRIANPSTPLTQAEFNVYTQHCANGVDAVKRLALPHEVLAVIAEHHEHADGTGYPRKLRGALMQQSAKVVAIANRYDELCNPSITAQARTPHEALSLMYSQQRNQFDATGLMVFVRCVGIYPPGTLVALNNGAIGMVTSVNSSRPLKPSVQIYDPNVPKDEAIIIDMEKEPDLVVARTLRPSELEPDPRAYLSPKKRMTVFFDVQPSKL